MFNSLPANFRGFGILVGACSVQVSLLLVIWGEPPRNSPLGLTSDHLEYIAATISRTTRVQLLLGGGGAYPDLLPAFSWYGSGEVKLMGVFLITFRISVSDLSMLGVQLRGREGLRFQ